VTWSAWVSLIALTGWLVLALSAWRARGVDTKRTLILVLAWGAIFVVVTAVFAAVGG
jgi:hypothetical protein